MSAIEVLVPSAELLATIERHRKRVWGLCYRMTGSRGDADDLSQEAIARAIERERNLAHREGLDGWLLRIATTVCLDHVRRLRIERRRSELVDPVEGPPLRSEDAAGRDPGAAVLLRDIVRVAAKPVFGIRAVARGFASVVRRQPLPVAARIRLLNREPAVVVTLPSAGDTVFASVHAETRAGGIVALRVVRDPRKLAFLGVERS